MKMWESLVEPRHSLEKQGRCGLICGKEMELRNGGKMKKPAEEKKKPTKRKPRSPSIAKHVRINKMFKKKKANDEAKRIEEEEAVAKAIEDKDAEDEEVEKLKNLKNKRKQKTRVSLHHHSKIRKTMLKRIQKKMLMKVLMSLQKQKKDEEAATKRSNFIVRLKARSKELSKAEKQIHVEETKDDDVNEEETEKRMQKKTMMEESEDLNKEIKGENNEDEIREATKSENKEIIDEKTKRKKKTERRKKLQKRKGRGRLKKKRIWNQMSRTEEATSRMKCCQKQKKEARPAIRSWNTMMIKKRINIKTRQKCLGSLEHHEDFNPEEEQIGIDLYKGTSLGFLDQTSDAIVGLCLSLKINSSDWSFISTILGQMTYLVADSTLDSARSCVMQGVSCIQRKVSMVLFSTPFVLSWGGSIISDSFLPSILLLVVIIVTVVIVVVILIVFVVAIVGVVIVVVIIVNCVLLPAPSTSGLW
nr:hypothetical protein [Tanacetum cinerariifolium]